MNTVKFHYYTKVMRMIRANTLVVDDSRNAVDASLCAFFFKFFFALIDNNGYQIKVFNERMFTLHSKHTFFISYLLPTPRPLDRLLIRLPTRRESELL